MELSLADVLTPGGLMALASVVLIDLTMAGDNIVIMGTIAARLPERERRRVIMLGVGFALVFLVGFALAATWLLRLPGLLLAGGLLLLWVAWNMGREAWAARDGAHAPADAGAVTPERTFLRAAARIMLADLSMSLDNVLAVAATARSHPTVLLFGMALSVSIMGLAANLVARLVARFRWVAWIGLLVVVIVAVGMVIDGWRQLAPVLGSTMRR